MYRNMYSKIKHHLGIYTLCYDTLCNIIIYYRIRSCRLTTPWRGLMSAYRREAIHWTAMARTRITNVVELQLDLTEPLYVSSSFLTTSLGCLSYSAVNKKSEMNKKKLKIKTANSDGDARYTAIVHFITSAVFEHFTSLAAWI